MHSRRYGYLQGSARLCSYAREFIERSYRLNGLLFWDTGLTNSSVVPIELMTGDLRPSKSTIIRVHISKAGFPAASSALPSAATGDLQN